MGMRWIKKRAATVTKGKTKIKPLFIEKNVAKSSKSKSEYIARSSEV